MHDIRPFVSYNPGSTTKPHAWHPQIMHNAGHGISGRTFEVRSHDSPNRFQNVLMRFGKAVLMSEEHVAALGSSRPHSISKGWVGLVGFFVRVQVLFPSFRFQMPRKSNSRYGLSSWAFHAHDAKTRTFRSTLPVAITHRIDILDVVLGSSLAPFGTEVDVEVPAPAASPFAPPPSLLNGGAQRKQLIKWPCASGTVRTHLHSWVRSQQRMDLSSDTDNKYFPPG